MSVSLEATERGRLRAGSARPGQTEERLLLTSYSGCRVRRHEGPSKSIERQLWGSAGQSIDGQKGRRAASAPV
jgi:hypothetical protein